ncbi:MAG TPA: hypothetical protein VKQ08_05585 [Cyclobacteriaceae bacterium]|nr:hypothetical protein [Cyclobacteriaceae bacterium]
MKNILILVMMMVIAAGCSKKTATESQTDVSGRFKDLNDRDLSSKVCIVSDFFGHEEIRFVFESDTLRSFDFVGYID